MFTPPRCPYESCTCHRAPRAAFFRRHGYYTANCRTHRVPRFICKSCGRSFSRQTFRADYYDKKPHLNPIVLVQITSGVGFRKVGRNLGITYNNLVSKWRKIAHHGHRLDLNLKGRASRKSANQPHSAPFIVQFDEYETYETRRNTRPLSVAVMIEAKTRFFVGSIAAPIRPNGRMTKSRIEAIANEERSFGARIDRSALACRRVFRSAAKLRPGARHIVLQSDEKTSYPKYFAEAFRERPRSHETTSSRAPRGAGTPLFPINHVEAIMRDHVARVRRHSWHVSKLRKYLNQHLGVYAAWRNWVLPRFIHELLAPGVLMGFAPRNLTKGEFLGWRQVWGQLSPCPFGRGRPSIGDKCVRS